MSFICVGYAYLIHFWQIGAKASFSLVRQSSVDFHFSCVFISAVKSTCL